MIAEVFTLGRFWIARRTSEANYDLMRPDHSVPVLSGTLEACMTEGQRLWKLEQLQDLDEPVADERPTDIIISDQVSVILVLPRTDAGTDWLKEHVDSEAMWFGPSLIVEPRYISDLVEGMMAEGLRISG